MIFESRTRHIYTDHCTINFVWRQITSFTRPFSDLRVINRKLLRSINVINPSPLKLSRIGRWAIHILHYLHEISTDAMTQVQFVSAVRWNLATIYPGPSWIEKESFCFECSASDAKSLLQAQSDFGLRFCLIHFAKWVQLKSISGPFYFFTCPDHTIDRLARNLVAKSSLKDWCLTEGDCRGLQTTKLVCYNGLGMIQPLYIHSSSLITTTA